MRRCGKSFLLFKLFVNYLEEQGIDNDHILKVNFEDFKNEYLRNAHTLYSYIEEHITDKRKYYILLDEVQLLERFEDVLNGFLNLDNVDIYVTGSNAKFLSKDIITEFRGRGYEIRIYPLNFQEFFSAYNGSVQSALNEYMLYGGLPQILSFNSDEQKVNFLKLLFTETYIKDIKDRYAIRNDDDLEELLNILSSNVGSLTNPNKLANTYQSIKKSTISYPTIKSYLDYLCDSFLIEKAMRYDVKAKQYQHSYEILLHGFRTAQCTH